jgi:hypothetical protein
VTVPNDQTESVTIGKEYSELERNFLDAADSHLAAWRHERDDRRRLAGLILIATALLSVFVLVLGQFSSDVQMERYAGLVIIAVLLLSLIASLFRSPKTQPPLSAADWLQLWRTDRHGPTQVLAFDQMAGKLVRPHPASLEALAELIWQGRIDPTILRSHFLTAATWCIAGLHRCG